MRTKSSFIPAAWIVFSATATLVLSLYLISPGITQAAGLPSHAQERLAVAGKNVGRDFFDQVVARLKDVSPSAAATNFLVVWAPHENTSAVWNPLATTWGMPGATNFNRVGVKNYPSKTSGVHGTANTLNLGYYDAIRRMMAGRSFDREALRRALSTWGTCHGATCNGLLNQRAGIYSGGGGGGGGASAPTTFVNGSSRLWQDQNWGRANLTVCAANLIGQIVQVVFFRDGKTWTYSQTAGSTCMTFWDMDGAGPLFRGITYFSKAALNQAPNMAWPNYGCYDGSGHQGLCDAMRQP